MAKRSNILLIKIFSDDIEMTNELTENQCFVTTADELLDH